MANATAKSSASKPSDAQKVLASSTSPRAAAPSEPDGSSKPNCMLKNAAGPVTAEVRRVMISEAAYYIAEHRGFAAGREDEDWLLAERQVDAALSSKSAPAKAA